jgi:hypothetical protein
MELTQNLIVVMGHARLVAKLAIQRIEQALHSSD